jgi:serine/threonine-protein phosphatase 2A regulatory subunit A
MSKFLGNEQNSVHLIKPLEQILPADDSVVREKAVESLKIVGAKISQEAVYEDFMPMVKRMRKGDLFSMRIAGCFLYAQIYGRLDAQRREYTRIKFQKLAKDDTPMVRRGAA